MMVVVQEEEVGQEVAGSFSMLDAPSLGPPNFNPKLHSPPPKLSTLQCHKLCGTSFLSWDYCRKWGSKVSRFFALNLMCIARCLNTLNSCGWGYGSMLTPLPPQRFPLRIHHFQQETCRHLSCQINTQIMCLLILNLCWIKYLTLSKINSQYTIPPDRSFPRLGRAGWIPTWCKCGNDPTTLLLRLQNFSNCIPHLCHTYIRCLNQVWTP